MKKRIVGFMALCLIGASLASCSASADKGSSKAPEAKTEAAEAVPAENAEKLSAGGAELREVSVLETGVISSIDEKSGSIVIRTEVQGEDGKTEEDELVANTDASTPVVSAESGKRLSRSDLKVGMRVSAWMSPEYTASYPPQSWALAFITDIDNGDVPYYAEIKSVKRKKWGMLLTDTSGRKWSIREDTVPYGSEGKKESWLGDLKKGSKCLIWPKKLAVNKGGDVLEAEKLEIL